MSCQAIGNTGGGWDFPLSFTERCELRLRKCLRCLTDCLPRCMTSAMCLGLTAAVVSVLLGYFVLRGFPSLISSCHKTPMLDLEDVSVGSMTVYQNVTVDQWQVKSEFNVTLFTRNRNSVTGCFTTFRRMVVYVGYRDQVIMQQEVPLGFGLKPKESRWVVAQVEGDHFPVDTESAQLLDAELRNQTSMDLQMYFDARVMRNDRKAKWVRIRCWVVVRTPLQSFPTSGNLFFKNCDRY